MLGCHFLAPGFDGFSYSCPLLIALTNQSTLKALCSAIEYSASLIKPLTERPKGMARCATRLDALQQVLWAWIKSNSDCQYGGVVNNTATVCFVCLGMETRCRENKKEPEI